MAVDYRQLPPYAADFLAYMETIKNCSANTVREYFYDVRMFLRFLESRKSGTREPFDEIDVSGCGISLVGESTLSDLYSFMTYLSRDRGASARSRARKTATLKSFYKYLFSKAKLIKTNPAQELELPKISSDLPRYLSLQECRKLLSSIDGRYHARDFAIVILLLNCGLRVSELVSININHIRDDDTLVVRGKGNKERTIYLNDACVYSLNEYLKVRPRPSAEDSKALFVSMQGNRISRKTIHHMLKKYFKKAGLDAEKYSAHKLRHTAATLMYRHGNVDIRALQGILGHKSISTTEIYTHIDDTKLRRAVESNPLSNIRPGGKDAAGE